MDCIMNEEVIVGTNEEFILGYQINKSNNGSYSFEPSFTNHSHSGRVKSMVVNKKYLVSGGSDEYMRIFNLEKRTEVGEIVPHEATITCLKFYANSFLLTGAENGKIGIYRKEKWKPMKFLSGHKACITGIGIHPSGKIAHTISRDRKMLTWDLTKGKRIYTATLKTAADDIEWSPSGSHYLITRGNIVDVYTIELGNVIYSITFKEKICTLKFVSEDEFIAGGEGEQIYFYNVTKKEIVSEWKSGQGRIKSLSLIKSWKGMKAERFLTASSDGTIKLWKFGDTCEDIPSELATVDTSCRIICMDTYSNRVRSYPEELSTENGEGESESVSSDDEDDDFLNLELSKKDVFASGTDAIGNKAKRKRVSIAEETIVIEEEEENYLYKPTVTTEIEEDEKAGGKRLKKKFKKKVNKVNKS